MEILILFHSQDLTMLEVQMIIGLGKPTNLDQVQVVGLMNLMKQTLK